jgi:hypothetical protein
MLTMKYDRLALLLILMYGAVGCDFLSITPQNLAGVWDMPIIIGSFLDTNSHSLLYTILLDNFVGLYHKSTISGLIIGVEGGRQNTLS